MIKWVYRAITVSLFSTGGIAKYFNVPSCCKNTNQTSEIFLRVILSGNEFVIKTQTSCEDWRDMEQGRNYSSKIPSKTVTLRDLFEINEKKKKF